MYNVYEVIILTVFLCIDDKNGMAFNNRRQSRDSVVIERITEMSQRGILMMNEYSAKLFDGMNVEISESFLEQAGRGDFCFVEKNNISEYRDKVRKIVLFKWNKVYPSDMKFDFDFSDFSLKETFDFEGTSHDVITCEVWKR